MNMELTMVASKTIKKKVKGSFDGQMGSSIQVNGSKAREVE